VPLYLWLDVLLVLILGGAMGFNIGQIILGQQNQYTFVAVPCLSIALIWKVLDIIRAFAREHARQHRGER